MALLLATAGIYGVLAGSVTERTREFGVRTALGATPRAIAAMVVRQGTSLAALGLAIGVGAATALSRFLRALLYGVEPSDPLALAFGVVAIGLVALAACVVPARRATRVDPIQALRE
jgi:ABC-type antimicrobial peptide transport system permease subunit